MTITEKNTQHTDERLPDATVAAIEAAVNRAMAKVAVEMTDRTARRVADMRDRTRTAEQPQEVAWTLTQGTQTVVDLLFTVWVAAIDVQRQAVSLALAPMQILDQSRKMRQFASSSSYES